MRRHTDKREERSSGVPPADTVGASRNNARLRFARSEGAETKECMRLGPSKLRRNIGQGAAGSRWFVRATIEEQTQQQKVRSDRLRN